MLDELQYLDLQNLVVGRHTSPTMNNAHITVECSDRTKHIHVIGQTGTGKSTTLENCILQDIYRGEGVCLIDPHGTSAQYVLDRIPEDRMKDVLYFNPSDALYASTFNILEDVAYKNYSKVTDLVVNMLYGLWSDSWGPRMEDILRNAIHAHLELPKQNYTTLLGIPRMLTNPLYREWIVKHTHNMATKSFWNDEFESWNTHKREEYIQPIMNKVRRFTQSNTLRHIIGFPESKLDLRYIMNNRKILIANLDTGKIGNTDANLLGSLLVTAIDFIARERDLTEGEPELFHVYIDEFQSFTTEQFSTSLSELRKYNISFFLAHQFIKQIKEPVRNALLGNIGTSIVFRVGGVDAEILALVINEDKSLLPALDDFRCYVKTKTDHMPTTYLAHTEVLPFRTTGYGKSIIARTRNDFSHFIPHIDEVQAHWYNTKKFK